MSIDLGPFQEATIGEAMIPASISTMMGIMVFATMGALAIGMVKPLFGSSEHRFNPLSIEEKRQACMREIAQWYGTYRREMTDEELRPIVRKYYPTDRELEEFLHFLQSPEGEQAMREELRFEAWRRGLTGPPHSSNPGPLEELESIARYAELASRLARSMRGATKKW